MLGKSLGAELRLGLLLGSSDGPAELLGSDVGSVEGHILGQSEGALEGDVLGTSLGAELRLGPADGNNEG